MDKAEYAYKIFKQVNLTLTPKALVKLTSYSSQVIESTARVIYSKTGGKPKVVTPEDIEEALKVALSKEIHRIPAAKSAESRIEVLTRQVSRRIAHGAEDFLNYMRARFIKLRAMLADTIGAEALSIADIAERNSGDVAGVAMVSDRRLSSNRMLLTLEDTTGTTAAIIDTRRIPKARELVTDIVIGFRGKVLKQGLIAVNSIVYPGEASYSKPNRSEEQVAAILLGDFHIGSSYFHLKTYRKLVEWLKGRSYRPEERRLSEIVKYMVIAGDLVDGIGVYPGQEGEIEIPDVYKQYEAAAELLKEVPDYIDIVYSPGNHEPMLDIEPQPPIKRERVKPLLEELDIKLIPNPAYIKLSGVLFLVYHGRSLNGWISSLFGAGKYTASDISRAMRAMLLARHLAPIYGSAPIAPQEKDTHIIELMPDVLQCGHTHVAATTKYQGRVLACTGGFQKKTPYMEAMGIHPTPGLIPVVQLDTLEVRVVDMNSAL